MFKRGEIVGVVIPSDISGSDLSRAKVDYVEVLFYEPGPSINWYKVEFKSNAVTYTQCWARAEWLVPLDIYNSPLLKVLRETA